MSYENLVTLAIDRALTHGAEYVEVRFQRNYEESIILKNGVVEAAGCNVKHGVSIRTLIDGALGFSTTNILTERAVEEAVEESVKLAKYHSSKLKKPVRFSSSPVNEVEYVVAERVKWMNIDLSEKIDELRGIDEVLQERWKIKFPYRLIELSYNLEEKFYENSEGTSVNSTVPRIRVIYVVTGMSGDKSIQRVGQIGGSGGWEVFLNNKIDERVREEAKALEEILLKGVKPPTGRMDLIVGSEVAGIIVHEAVGHPFEADRILGREAAQGGESYLSVEDVGSEIGSSEVNVSDDPTIPSSYGYYLYDDEGVKARKRTLIKSGKVEELLHNRETAAQLGVESNGSARATNYSVEPIIRMANTFFEPGDYRFEEMVEEVKHGVYFKSFTEWNIDDRRVNQRYVGLEAYLIENGEITKPLRNPLIETTTHELLRKLDARGRDLEFWAGTCGKGDPMQGIPVWAGGPHLRFRDIWVGSR